MRERYIVDKPRENTDTGKLKLAFAWKPSPLLEEDAYLIPKPVDKGRCSPKRYLRYLQWTYILMIFPYP